MAIVANKPNQDQEDEIGQVEKLQDRIKALEEEKLQKQKGQNQLHNSIENITKVVAGVASALVALGFIFYIMGYHIVSDYYSLFGLRDFTVSRPVYLSAGVVFILVNLLPVLIASIIVIVLKKIFETQFPEPDTEKVKIRAMNRMALALIPCLFVPIYLSYGVLISDLTDYKIFMLGKICTSFLETECESFAGLYLVLSLSSAVLLSRMFENNREVLISWLFMFGIFFIWVLSSMLNWWGQEVYPNISPSFAGGEPSEIQLVISKVEYSAQFATIGIPVENNVTAEILLIDEGPDYITVVSESCNAVKISKSQFVNILYQKDRSEINPMIEKCIPGNSGAELLPP